MKKKILLTLVLLCMVCGFMSCGKSKGKVSAITIKGKEYDLSQDFQSVVGRMVKNGIKVCASNGGYTLYDDNGKFTDKSAFFDEECNIQAFENRTRGLEYSHFNKEESLELLNERGHFIRKDYWIYDMEQGDVVSGLGVASAEDMEDKLDACNFLKFGRPLHSLGDTCYLAVFVDGKALDFSAYKDDLAELKKYEFSPEWIWGIFAKYFPHMAGFGIGYFNGDVYKACRDYDDIEKNAEGMGYLGDLDKEFLLQFALEDAFQQLKDKKIEKIIVVSFGIMEEDETVNMGYTEYYFDKTWDYEKYK